MKITEAQLRSEIRSIIRESAKKNSKLNEASIVAAAAKTLMNKLKQTNAAQEDTSQSLQDAIKAQMKDDEVREYENLLRKVKLAVKDKIVQALESSRVASEKFAPKMGGNPEFVSLGVVDGLMSYIDTVCKQYYTKMTTGKNYIWNREAAEANAKKNAIYDPKKSSNSGSKLDTTGAAPSAKPGQKTTTQVAL